MFGSILNSFFACSHKRTTFPMTPARRSADVPVSTPLRGTYVACLDCGKELGYDWDKMRIGKPVAARIPSPQAVPLDLRPADPTLIHLAGTR